ncbi:tetratricopeptide repeat protein [Nevskia sp.]|uniref:protein kinase domain-containing protein n=1 Tax=Nevskia sp. TaxID=1929292 RepID=UPI0025E37F3B|nr:tetratricopeptide repeat protein [Nevskia sp.]
MTQTADKPAAGNPILWRFGDVQFDEASLVLKLAGAVVALEHRPQELLRLLLAHAGEVVTKEEILDAVWPGRIVTEASLTKCVARLRQAIGDSEQTLIRTVHGYGYRLAAEVSSQSSGRGDAASSAGFDFTVGAALPFRPHWQFRERLGGGGFGEVWLGQHAKTHERRVFKFAAAGTPTTALKREITLFRLLNDTLGPRDDITRILDWQLDDAPHFIELEYSPEGSLQQWAEAGGGLAQRPLDTRVRLVIEIADALAAIHSAGVLHKDLKPANVLIRLASDETPHIRLTDFGSGRVLDAEKLDALGITRLGFTRTVVTDGTTSGTPLYLAPELLAGQPPSARADVYALGVVLYQMVVGDFRRPLAPGWEADIADELLREDIAAAAAGDPDKRLGDAAQLALRLRSLDLRRVDRARERQSQAHAAQLEQRLARAHARRGLLRALAATLLIGFAVSTVLYFRAEAESRRAEAQAQAAQAVTDFLTRNLLSAANPLISADPDIRLRELIGPAAEELKRSFPGDSLSAAAIADAIGQAYSGFDAPRQAIPLLESAVAQRSRLLGEAAADTQATRLRLLNAYENANELERERQLAQAVLDLGRAAGTLDAATELTARQALIAVDCGLRGGQEACLAPELTMVAEMRQRLGADHEITVQTEDSLAYYLADAQRFDEALPLARDVLARTARRHGERHILTVSRQRSLGTVLNMAGRPEEAIHEQRAAREAAMAISGGRETQYSVTAANGLAYSYFASSRHAEALPLFQLYLDYQRQNGAETDTPKLTRSLNNVAMTLMHLKRAPEALPLAREALAIDQRTVGPDHPDTLVHTLNLALVADAAGAATEAEQLARMALAGARRVYRNGEWDLGWFAYKTGSLLAAHGRKAEARPLLAESLDTYTRALGPDNDNTLKARDALAHL